jgi:hypothetical protein
MWRDFAARNMHVLSSACGAHVIPEDALPQVFYQGGPAGRRKLDDDLDLAHRTPCGQGALAHVPPHARAPLVLLFPSPYSHAAPFGADGASLAAHSTRASTLPCLPRGPRTPPSLPAALRTHCRHSRSPSAATVPPLSAAPRTLIYGFEAMQQATLAERSRALYPRWMSPPGLILSATARTFRASRRSMGRSQACARAVARSHVLMCLRLCAKERGGDHRLLAPFPFGDLRKWSAARHLYFSAARTSRPPPPLPPPPHRRPQMASVGGLWGGRLGGFACRLICACFLDPDAHVWCVRRVLWMTRTAGSVVGVFACVGTARL